MWEYDRVLGFGSDVRATRHNSCRKNRQKIGSVEGARARATESHMKQPDNIMIDGYTITQITTEDYYAAGKPTQLSQRFR